VDWAFGRAMVHITTRSFANKVTSVTYRVF